MVATGISGARACNNEVSILGGPTSWSPRGTVWRILMGYFPDADRWSRQYSQAAMVSTMITAACLQTERKKNRRPSKHGLSDL